MLKKIISILILTITTVIVSAQDYYTTIDILKPGCLVFPSSVSNVLVVNNAVNQPHDYGHQSHLAGQVRSTTIVDTDSAVLYFLSTFTKSLEEQEFFDNVDLLEKSQNHSGQYFQQHSITSLQADHLRKMYDADALIVLNRLMLSDLVEDFMTDADDYYASLEVRCVSIWHIFMPNGGQPQSLTLADTLVWENRDLRRSDAINNLPNRRDALLDMSIYSAEETAKKIIPHWEQRDRYFYKHSDRRMKAGIDSLYHKKWDAAINEWYNAYQQGNNKLKARAAANIAATFEIEGDINSALYWAQQAAEHFNNHDFFGNEQRLYENMVLYANELSARLEDEKLLYQQSRKQ